jgi:hypothetical protein
LNKSWYNHYQRVIIKAWGSSRYGGTGAPDGSGYTKVYSTGGAFAVIETDGSITAWGYSFDGGMNAPSTGVYTKIYSTPSALRAAKALLVE